MACPFAIGKAFGRAVSHALKDPNVTVNYQKDRRGPLSNHPIEAPNDLEAIIKLIR